MAKVLTHSDLCEAAVRWLYGTMKCNVALSGIASTSEIPDAIGWSTSSPLYGSIVVECKMSVSDFRADAKKKHESRMGDFRVFLVPEGLVSSTNVQELYPKAGLAYKVSRGVRLVLHPARCEAPNRNAENRLLQFALVHVKENLLGMGCSVDMSTLTKSWFTNCRNRGFCNVDTGVDFPQPPFSFNEGECK